MSPPSLENNIRTKNLDEQSEERVIGREKPIGIEMITKIRLKQIKFKVL